MPRINKVKKSIILKFLFLGLLVLLLIVLVIFLSPGRKAKNNIKSPSSQHVPELSDILSPNQETRLKGARALAERVGVEEALEILKNSGLPSTGEGHLAVHQVGFYAYKKYGKDAILHCKDYFLNACYHGAIIEAASDGGFEVIAEMANRCSQYPTRYFQCVHASGHAILAIWNYDLAKALKTCDELFEGKEAYPGTLPSCHNGAFMENLFGVHDWGTDKTPKRDWLSDDPYFPCSAFSEKYQKGCWLNQAARIYQLAGGDLVKTAQGCYDVKNDQYRAWCFDNLARQIHPLTEGHIDRVFNLCKTVGPQWELNCIIVNAGSYASVGDPKLGIDICNLLNEPLRTNCFGPVVDYFASDGTSYSDQVVLCNRIQGSYAQECLVKIQS